MEITPMTPAYAAELATWAYPAPYDYNSMCDADPDYFTDPANGFVALVEDDTLIAFRSFGPDGRVPGGAYDDEALDTGGGLRPDLTGKGLGRAVIAAGLAYGQRVYQPSLWRVTVAASNARALKVVTSLGFTEASAFEASTDGRAFRILTRPAD